MSHRGRAEAEQRFRLLYERYWHRVTAYIRRRCDDVPTADEAVAEVFVIAWRRMNDIPADRELTWLLGVARKVLANRRRSEMRHKRLLARLEHEAHTMSNVETSPSDMSYQADVVRDALERLRPVDAEILRLVSWENLTYAQIAEMFGCTLNAVGVRLHRARQRLAAELADHQVLEKKAPYENVRPSISGPEREQWQ